MSIFREIFQYSKTETLGVAFLLILMIIGGGILLYQKTSQSLPPELFIETHRLQESAKQVKASNNKLRQTHNYLLTELSEKKININTAPSESLQLLPYVGQVTANRIITYREQVGRFDSLPQLIEVKGIGQKRLQQIRQYLITE